MILYNLVYNLLRLILSILKPFLNQKTQQWIDLRNDKTIFKLKIDSSRPKIWIHASSGEIEYAKSFIREYKKSYPQSHIFVSYSSLSAPLLFKNIQSEVTVFFPLNWDITRDNEKLLDFIRPDILIFSRTDFWPNLIQQAHRRKIKLAAIAVNPSQTRIESFLLKFSCKNFDFISCVEQEQVPYLQKLLPNTEVTYIPDTRFDQVFYRLSQSALIHNPPNENLITLGSTWPKDDEVLKSAAAELLEKKYSLIWAPHDIKHAIKLFNELKKQLPSKKITLLANYTGKDEFDILIIDRIGVLADFYRYSKISFVGGSFVSRVHSVMEPLCAGNFVIVGPYYANNPEAIAFKKKNLVKSVRNGSEFLDAVKFFEENQSALNDLKKRTESKKGGSIKTVSAIAELLKTI